MSRGYTAQFRGHLTELVCVNDEAFAANGRAINALKGKRDFGDHAKYSAFAIEDLAQVKDPKDKRGRVNLKAVDEVSDMVGRLKESDAEAAALYEQDVLKRLKPETLAEIKALAKDGFATETAREKQAREDADRDRAWLAGPGKKDALNAYADAIDEMHGYRRHYPERYKGADGALSGGKGDDTLTGGAGGDELFTYLASDGDDDPKRRHPANPMAKAFSEKARLADDEDKPVAKPKLKPKPDWSDDDKETFGTLNKLIDYGERKNRPESARLLRHYLSNSGEPVTLDADWVRKHPPVTKAQERVESHFEEWLQGGQGDKTLGHIDDWIKSGKKTLELKNMHWDGSADSSSVGTSDQNNALGATTVKGMGELTLERNGDRIIVRGKIDHNLDDDYDFKKAGASGLPFAQGFLVGDFGLTRDGITALEKAGGAKAFKVYSTPWRRELQGELTLRNGKIVGSRFKWNDGANKN